MAEVADIIARRTGCTRRKAEDAAAALDRAGVLLSVEEEEEEQKKPKKKSKTVSVDVTEVVKAGDESD